MDRTAQNARSYIQSCWENRHNKDCWEDYDLIGALLDCTSDGEVVRIQQHLQDEYPEITPHQP